MKHVKMYEENSYSIILFKNEKELKTLLLKNEDFSKGDVFHGIIDVLYEDYSSDINYDDFLNLVKEKYGTLPCFCVLLGNYNGQVFNGGHLQYYDNGYASSKSKGYYNRGGNPYNNVDIHEKMIILFEKLKISEHISKKLVYDAYSIMKDFNFDSVNFNCYNGDNGEYSEYDNDKNEDLDKLDQRWYDINEDFIDEFNNYLKSLNLEGDSISKLIELSNKINKYNI